jgi:hypothetical protein
METRGRRAARAAGPVEIPPSQAVAAEGPGQTMPTEAPGPILPAEGQDQILPAEARDEIPAEPAAAPASEAVMPSLPPAPALGAPPAGPGQFGGEALAALEESRVALAAGLEALSEEVAGLARCGIDTTARTAIEMLAVKTLSDAIAVNAGFARTSYETWVGAAARFCELGAKLAADSSRPLLVRLGGGRVANDRDRV